MSAYGDIHRAHSIARLPPTAWTRTGPAAAAATYSTPTITVHHLTLETARAMPGLLAYLSAVFAQEVADGRTYPQEGAIPQPTFEAYFFAADVFVGVAGQAPTSAPEIPADIEAARGSHAWEACIAGYYYIKPNYPGRSSHICNAGFVVPPNQRGRGYGSLLAESYVHYAPRLGYQASVFNLVYVNNGASVRLWEKLGFTKAGRIPRAGRLRTGDGQGEEYVDAWVIYRSFVDAEDTVGPSGSS
ncbi:hypothetical protein HYPSUDRAFT_34937 [Hypholoma sublateritium FD-334 SS-4]|uniref:N-acetyltransferase domain-containing protein n=1 Tax=Hypholoma sublateritium (strain FD-334 SS-4) TaxID=945553 RepID=A0A0D2Q7U2_HYPSF|nr:hypothetical protein HYPSUDRAFT_34937 [Hypholoma sublateritium FD-334 SS-4]